jgi:GNAT superfamily N-acetyltransferase
MVNIQNPKRLDHELYNAILNLLPQLNDNHPLPSQAELRAVLKSNTTTLFIARYPDLLDPIVGMLTLVIYRVPSGICAHVEDMVVDKKKRGLGIASALMQTALLQATETGANRLVLTSHPRRKAANELYKKLGFTAWDTNLYYLLIT